MMLMLMLQLLLFCLVLENCNFFLQPLLPADGLIWPVRRTQHAAAAHAPTRQVASQLISQPARTTCIDFDDVKSTQSLSATTVRTTEVNEPKYVHIRTQTVQCVTTVCVMLKTFLATVFDAVCCFCVPKLNPLIKVFRVHPQKADT